jgi:hypothetical protein
LVDRGFAWAYAACADCTELLRENLTSNQAEKINMAEDLKSEKPKSARMEFWSDFGAAVSKMAAGTQPRFAFVITSPTGPGICWAESSADVLALAAALDHAAADLRRHGATMGPEPTGKPN